MNRIIARPIIRMLALPALTVVCLAGEVVPGLPPGARPSWLDNGQVRVGVDLNHGGAIVFVARAGGENVVNNFDLGRQVQLSFYSGPVPFSSGGQNPAPHWAHLGWNPVQTGDDFRNPSAVLQHSNDGKTLHVRCRPMQWPLNNVPGECTFDSWITLDGPVVRARARLTNARADRTQHPARLQELPAVYANAAFPRVVSYTGDRPFTGGAVTEIPKSKVKHPWTSWTGTEGWSALLNAQDRGLGLITPGRVDFTGGFAGRPGPNDSLGNSTGYVAGHGKEILDADIVYEFAYELLPGTLAEIRARAATHRPVAPPAWVFASDRRGWFYQHATDSGWPVRGHLDVRLEKPDPQLLSPVTFWRAEDAPVLEIDAAFRTAHREAVVYWQPLGQGAPGPQDRVAVPITGDGEFRTLRVKLAAAPSYRGALSRLRLDPAPAGAPGDFARIRAIRLLPAATAPEPSP